MTIPTNDGADRGRCRRSSSCAETTVLGSSTEWPACAGDGHVQRRAGGRDERGVRRAREGDRRLHMPPLQRVPAGLTKEQGKAFMGFVTAIALSAIFMYLISRAVRLVAPPDSRIMLSCH